MVTGMSLPDAPKPPASPMTDDLFRIYVGPIAGLTRDELLRRLRSQYVGLGNLDRSVERAHEEIRTTIAALDACEVPVTDRELRLAMAGRYDKPRVL